MAVFLQSLYPGAGASTLASALGVLLAEDAGNLLAVNAAGRGAMDIHYNLAFGHDSHRDWHITERLDYTEASLDTLLDASDSLLSNPEYGEILADIGARNPDFMRAMGPQHLYLTIAEADTHSLMRLTELSSEENEFILVNKKHPFSAINREIVTFIQGLTHHGITICPVSIPFDDFIEIAAAHRLEATTAYPFSAAVGALRSLASWIYSRRMDAGSTPAEEPSGAPDAPPKESA